MWYQCHEEIAATQARPDRPYHMALDNDNNPQHFRRVCLKYTTEQRKRGFNIKNLAADKRPRPDYQRSESLDVPPSYSKFSF